MPRFVTATVFALVLLLPHVAAAQRKPTCSNPGVTATIQDAWQAGDPSPDPITYALTSDGGGTYVNGLSGVQANVYLCDGSSDVITYVPSSGGRFMTAWLSDGARTATRIDVDRAATIPPNL